ncbi:MAG TPA: GntR family transcriptional regulator [Streptosporangiales bacterium]
MSGEGKSARQRFSGTPIARPPRLADTVAEQIRGLVLDGQIRPGEPLRQEHLAERLGISRTPLRQALQLLEKEGLMVFSPSGTASVVELTKDDAGELLDLRDIVDGFAARRLARMGMTAETEAHLERVSDEMVRAFDAGEKPRYLVLNADFHLTILRATKHSRLNQFASLVQLSSQVPYLEGPTMPERLRRSIEEHRQIVEAIRVGDQDAAERAARGHVKRAFSFWYSEQPDDPPEAGPEGRP